MQDQVHSPTARHLTNDLNQFTLNLPQRDLSRFLNHAIAVTEITLGADYTLLQMTLALLNLIRSHILRLSLQLLLLVSPAGLLLLRIARQFITPPPQHALSLLRGTGKAHYVGHADHANHRYWRCDATRNIGRRRYRR
ncbi:hypothetical protein C7453_106112 [Gluconacetobacter liquefaciens]|uniref:Uncharacterized protein n=1 Tax=Gluconacetobacter liquefaciens TaxID=89584 RepID=A0A370G3I3_GLULI|nr:hypothetical protein C7453_106112 [Gluconacetobacter liquefaciens]